jgi:hypothetical protein
MHTLHKMTSFLVCLLCVGNCNGVSTLDTRLVVESNVPVTPPNGGHLDWFEMKADPEDGNNLIVCGARQDARDNAYYGVVYSSWDGGRSWKTVLEDRGGTWVSEQSCAFGQRHVAYFISQATVDPRTPAEVEATRIFVSSDAGRTWTESAKTEGADYTNSVIARSPDSSTQQLYVFYNGSSKSDPVKKLGSTVDFFTVSEDGTRVSQRQTVPGMAELNYHGVYPSSSVVLNDGTPVVLYDAGQLNPGANGIGRFDIGVARFALGRPPESTVVATYSARNKAPGPLCPASLSNSLAYDKVRNRLYVAYNDIASHHCALMLTSSGDGGRTWAPPHELHASQNSHSTMYFPILTVNHDGVMGLLWRGKPRHSPDCWYFSLSRTGLNLEQTTLLSPCFDDNPLKKQSTGYLFTTILQAKAGQPASVDVLTRRDDLLRIGITATPDGVFHPVWSTFGDGFGELRTARIRIARPSHPTGIEPINQAGLTEVTDKITTLYGGEQRLDHESNSAILELSFRNNSPNPIKGPLYLKIENTSSDFGTIEFVNRGSLTSLGASYSDVSSLLPTGSLAPGETTSTYRLNFHFTNENPAVGNRSFILRLKLRIFCQQQR